MSLLLQVLSDGEYHSGEDLGKLLGISRAGVWKQIQKIEMLGLSVIAQKGCGYRIEGGLDLLNNESLLSFLSIGGKSVLSKLEVLATVASTNDIAKQRAEICDASGLVVISEQQTDGRGRRGRAWISPFGCSIYLSIVWGFDTGVKALEGLSLAVGVVVLELLEASGLEGLELKWPNDLLWKNRKIGGILLEVVGDPLGYCQVVVGVGVNVKMDKTFESVITQQWSDLNEVLLSQTAQDKSPITLSRNQLGGTIIDALLHLLSDYHKTGFKAYRDSWLQRDAYLNRPVQLLLMNKSVYGIARGVDYSGALQLETDDAIRTFSGGEITLRGAG